MGLIYAGDLFRQVPPALTTDYLMSVFFERSAEISPALMKPREEILRGITKLQTQPRPATPPGEMTYHGDYIFHVRWYAPPTDQWWWIEHPEHLLDFYIEAPETTPLTILYVASLAWEILIASPVVLNIRRHLLHMLIHQLHQIPEISMEWEIIRIPASEHGCTRDKKDPSDPS